MDILFRALNASRVDASIPAYGTGLYTTPSVPLRIAVSLERPTHHSGTI
jgi:hypothetical protein